MEPVSPALEAESLNHWTTREVPIVPILEMRRLRHSTGLLQVFLEDGFQDVGLLAKKYEHLKIW